MVVAEAFTGREGRFVQIEDTIRGFAEIIAGKHDDLPEQAFYMVGSIDEAVEQAKRMAGEEEPAEEAPAETEAEPEREPEPEPEPAAA